MVSKSTVEKIFSAYTSQHTDEDQSLLKLFLKHTDEPKLFDRKNFEGHITASAVILDATRKFCLLLEHKYLKIWLPPGGHVDAEDASLEDAALREASEETSIGRHELKFWRFAAGEFLPMDFDSHQIPANPKKDEPAHLHHDAQFLFQYTGSGRINPDPEETRQLQWFALTSLQHNPRFERLFTKVIRLLSE